LLITRGANSAIRTGFVATISATYDIAPMSRTSFACGINAAVQQK
jgi:hypothetical protein